ncbi:MAG: hypothetical protein B7X43_02795 [Thiomonas sp. 15-63-373]|nr:MAG: hypothetical protein B7X43_02795 [Thiomonas sp. 15-63-373]
MRRRRPTASISNAAKDAELSEVEKAAAEIGAGLRKTAADGRQSLEAQAVKMTAQLTEQLTRTLQATAADIIARQVDPLNRAQQSLTRTVEAANARMAAAGRWFGAKAVVLALALTLIVGLAAWGLVYRPPSRRSRPLWPHWTSAAAACGGRRATGDCASRSAATKARTAAAIRPRSVAGPPMAAKSRW